MHPCLFGALQMTCAVHFFQCMDGFTWMCDVEVLGMRYEVKLFCETIGKIDE